MAKILWFPRETCSMWWYPVRWWCRIFGPRLSIWIKQHGFVENPDKETLGEE